MGTGPTIRDWQRQRVACLECGVVVAAGLLLTHFQSQHGVDRGGTGGGNPPRGRPKLTSSISLNVCVGSGDQYKGAWEGLRIIPTSRFTFCTATRGTQ